MTVERKLNLVYDDWDEESGRPRPNGNKIYGNEFWNGQNLITNYINVGPAFEFYQDQFPEPSDRFKIVTCRLEEVKNNPNEKYYYVIDHANSNLCRALSCGPVDNWETIQAVIDRKPPIGDEVMEYLRNQNNFFLMMLTAHEPEGEQSFQCLKDFIDKHSIPPKKIFIVNNNSKLNELKHKHELDINVHSIKFIPNSSNLTLSRIQSVFNENKEGKFFLCHNKSPKPHRYAILVLLKNQNILEDVNWSLVSGFKFKDELFFCHLFTKEDTQKYNEEIEFFTSIDVKKSEYELQEKWFNPNSTEINVEGLPHWMRIPEKPETFENSYVNIVTESSFIDSESVVHITEKSFRPFYFYQLPIFVSSHNHVKYLKEIYGFDMFEDVINHSYDDVVDDRNRLFEIMKEIKRLDENKEKIKEFYKKNYDRFEKNKNIIFNILKNADDYKFFRSLV
jgi:hypothetical protein